MEGTARGQTPKEDRDTFFSAFFCQRILHSLPLTNFLAIESLYSPLPVNLLPFSPLSFSFHSQTIPTVKLIQELILATAKLATSETKLSIPPTNINSRATDQRKIINLFLPLAETCGKGISMAATSISPCEILY